MGNTWTLSSGDR